MNAATIKYRLPGWLYEALPYVYLATGALVMFFLNNSWGIFSGAVLLSAGAAVSIMRIRYRKFHGNGGASSVDKKMLEIETLESGSVQLVWSKKYECGNSGIDAQHKGLFELANKLLDAIHDGKGKGVLMNLTDRLLDHVKSHFSSEEALMESWGHTLTEEHKVAHRYLLDKAMDLREKLDNGSLLYHDVFTFFINDLVLRHIVEEDRKFFFQL